MSEPTYDFGDLNEHMISILMKEIVQRARREIVALRHTHTTTPKETEGKNEDLYTDADTKAQDRGVRSLRECTPEFGIVAEEDHFRVKCTHPTHDIWWTLDALDGTKAFARGESSGVGTMIALVCDGQIIAAYVGDVLVNEGFGYRPLSSKMHYIDNGRHVRNLVIDESQTLASQAVGLRDPIRTHSTFMQEILADQVGGGLFKKFTPATGSIGLSMSKLWKGIEGAAVLPEGIQSPWDLMPVVGICQHLGFVFLEVNSPLHKVTPRQIMIQKEPQYFDFETIVIHESRVDEFMEYVETLKS